MTEQASSLQYYLPFFGALIGAAIPFVTTMIVAKRKDEKDRRRTCAILAQQLDVFANECSNVIADNNVFNTSDGHAGRGSSKIPLIAEINEAASLGLVEPEHLSRLLSLRLKRDMAAQKISFYFDVLGPDSDLGKEADQQCGILGTEALCIARQLRSSAQLPDPNYKKYHWDISAGLKEQRNKAILAKEADE